MRQRCLKSLLETRKSTLVGAFCGLAAVHFIIVYFEHYSILSGSKRKIDGGARMFFNDSNETFHDRTTQARITKTALKEVATRYEKDPTKCEVPGIIHDGVPWPDCFEKIRWMKSGWKTDECYANHGISDDICSVIRYLSEVERHCPQTRRKEINLEPLFLKGANASFRTNFEYLFKEIESVDDYSRMKSRIHAMQDLWLAAARDLFSTEPQSRKKKRILVHMGLFRLGIGRNAGKGGPLGELVQWSDVIASLYVMGHDIVLTRNKAELRFVFDRYINQWNSGCPTPSPSDSANIPFDLIYTDITGYRDIQVVVKGNKLDSLRCRFRIVDSFGTEAEFNNPHYRNKKNNEKSQFGDLNLNLKQFNTMFPHTPDNTFLGFVTEFAMNQDTSLQNSTPQRDIALVYGKQEAFWKGKENYIDIVKEYVTEVHGTVQDPKNISSYVVNHGVLPFANLSRLLRRTKIFLGLGFPYEGPAPLEAIQHGAVFLNPRFNEPISSDNSDFYKRKPTRRKVTSQNPYAENYIGEPYVYTVDIDDENALRSTLRRIVTNPEPGEYLPYEFSTRGMLERVSLLVEKQQFCVDIPYSTMPLEYVSRFWWPPLSALQVKVTENSKGQSCNDACEAAGLICEPTFFPILNRGEAFERAEVNLPCKEVKTPEEAELDYPAYDPDSQTCYLQTNPMLFSCAGSYVNIQRICPCRDFLHGQTAMCKDCVHR